MMLDLTSISWWTEQIAIVFCIGSGILFISIYAFFDIRVKHWLIRRKERRENEEREEEYLVRRISNKVW